MIFDVVTIFPNMFAPVICESIIKRAVNKGLVKINIHDLRQWAYDKHKSVDDTSYGSGCGMVFKPEPLFAAVEGLLGYKKYPVEKKDKNIRVVLMGPQGKTLTQASVKRFLKYERLIILAPRYEGVDERVREHLVDEEVSIGDYVLSGGELPAMVFIDTLVRLIPGVVSDQDSVKNESFENGLLDFPHYTKPAEFRGLQVPAILMSGHHAKVEEWRKKKALELTKKLRPDILKKSGGR